jgi:outer membrane protein OmpA-like peptidoglycan-associated protein
MSDAPTDAHYDFAAKICGFDPRDAGVATGDASPDQSLDQNVGGADQPNDTDPSQPANAGAGQPDLPADAGQAPPNSPEIAAGGTPDPTIVLANAPTQQLPDINSPALDATDHDVFFSRDSATLTPSDQKSLSAYADRYIQNANPTPITVDAYASIDGDAQHNQTLSEQRAQAVKSFLSDTKGIKGELITATGHGATASFSKDRAAPNRRAVFGPPVPDSTKQDSTKQDSPAGGQSGAGTDQSQSQQQKTVTTKAEPVPPLTLTPKQFTDIFGVDLLAQWNAFKTKGGPVPPSRQLNVTLTLKGSLIPDKNNRNLKIDWFGDPSISVVFNSSGTVANDQEAANIVKLHWDNTVLKRPIELSIQAVSQNLFTSGASPQGGVQPQGKVQVTKEVGVVVGGSFMLGNGSDDKFNLNASGFLGVDITLF